MIAIAVPETHQGPSSTMFARSAAAIGTGVLFELLADSTRRRILALLLEHREICVCAWSRALIAAAQGIAPSRRDARGRAARLAPQGHVILYRFDPQVPGWRCGHRDDGRGAGSSPARDGQQATFALELCGEDAFP